MRPCFTLTFVFLFLVPWCSAGEANDRDLNKLTIAEIQQEIQILTDRVEALEEAQGDLPGWLDRFTFKGDFRYRHEYINQEDDGKAHRTRHRIRARVFIGTEVNEYVDFGFQFATGDNEDWPGGEFDFGGDPVSTNQTIGDAFSNKFMWVDLAYFDFHPIKDSSIYNLNIIGGKMKTPYRVMSKSELLWDPDLRPEGGAVILSRETDNLKIFSSLGGFYIKERGGNTSGASRSADSGMVGGQVGFTVPVNDDATVTAGSGYYDFINIKGYGAFFEDLGGNSSDAMGNYDEDFDILEYFAEVGFEFVEIPVSVFGNYSTNIGATGSDVAYLAGVKLGKAKDPGSWEFRYQYKMLQADSVFGLFTDSDFGGGGTDSKGHEFNLAYALMKNWVVALTYFDNDVNISDPSNKKDYERIQFDLKFKF
jgi:hypothetical protein